MIDPTKLVQASDFDAATVIGQVLSPCMLAMAT